MKSRSRSAMSIVTIVLSTVALVVDGVSAASPSPAALDAVESPSGSPATGWTLIALGDSIVSAGVENREDGYPEIYAERLAQATGHPIRVRNLADDAATSASLLAALQAPGRLRDAVSGADIVTITVGGNDGDPFGDYPPGTCAPGGPAADCLAAYVPELARHYDAILSEIEIIRAGKPTAIRPTSPDYDPFIGWDQAPSPTFGVDFYRQVVEAETGVVCAAAAAHGGQCADFTDAFNGPDGTIDAAPLLASDHAHPSTLGSSAIADVLMSLDIAPLE